MWHVFLLIIFIVYLRREVRKITFGYLPPRGLFPYTGYLRVYSEICPVRDRVGIMRDGLKVRVDRTEVTGKRD